MKREAYGPFRHSTRFLALLLGLFTLATTLPAGGADISPAGIDGPLSQWLGRWQPLRFSASFQADALLPFLDDQLDPLNALLGHMALDAILAEEGDDASATLRFRCNREPVMTIAEVRQAGAYTLRTDLLPNRTLESRFASPLALLAGLDGEGAISPTSGSAEEKKDPSLPPGTFDILSAIHEAEECYKALIEACEPYATKKRANYRIKNIGLARWSQTARLTPDQSNGMLPLLRNMLQCGMDDAYREELDQTRFGKDLVVALYRAGEKERDMAIYMKGTLIFPDGVSGKLAYQWAFVNDGAQRKDSYKLEVTPQKSERHIRLAEAFITQIRFEDDMTLKGSSQLTLRQGKASEARLLKMDLAGKGDDAGRDLKGSWSEEVKRAESKDASTTAVLTVTPDLRVSADPEGSLLSGQVQVERRLNKTVTASLRFTFAPKTDFLTLSEEADFSHGTATPSAPDHLPLSPSDANHNEDIFAGELMERQDEDVSLDLSFLVSDEPTSKTAPIGLKAYPIPADMTCVSLDSLHGEGRLNLMDEMGQRLAGRLLIALFALPPEDMALLTDVLREEDLPAFLALFN